MSTIGPHNFKHSLKGLSFQNSKAYAEGVENLATARLLDSVDVQKAGTLYTDFQNVASFVKGHDQKSQDRDLAKDSVALLRVTQPLCAAFQGFVAHVRSVDALMKPDGSMTVEAGTSYHRGQPSWPARTYTVCPEGVVLMKEGSFVAQYDPAQKVLSWGLDGNP